MPWEKVGGTSEAHVRSQEYSSGTEILNYYQDQSLYSSSVEPHEMVSSNGNVFAGGRAGFYKLTKDGIDWTVSKNDIYGAVSVDNTHVYGAYSDSNYNPYIIKIDKVTGNVVYDKQIQSEEYVTALNNSNYFYITTNYGDTLEARNKSDGSFSHSVSSSGYQVYSHNGYIYHPYSQSDGTVIKKFNESLSKVAENSNYKVSSGLVVNKHGVYCGSQNESPTDIFHFDHSLNQQHSTTVNTPTNGLDLGMTPSGVLAACDSDNNRTLIYNNKLEKIGEMEGNYSPIIGVEL